MGVVPYRGGGGGGEGRGEEGIVVSTLFRLQDNEDKYFSGGFFPINAYFEGTVQ